MTTLLLRQSTSLKEMRDQLLVHRIPAMLESKRRREKRFLAFSMAVSFQDALASTCLHFVEVLRVRRCRLGTEPGAVYYLRSSNDTVVRVGESTSRSTHNLQYTADVPFIKKYSVLFELGEQLEWEKAGDFENWLTSIVNARPRFIQPFYGSANALPVLPTSPHGIDHHCCWFVDDNGYTGRVHTKNLRTTRCCGDNPQWCSVLPNTKTGCRFSCYNWSEVVNYVMLFKPVDTPGSVKGVS